MVIKGTSCAGGRRLAIHLSRTDSNERAEVKQLHGVTATELRGALLEMEAMAAGARTERPFYHASINTRADERLTEVQRLQAIDRLEAKLRLVGQPRVVVVHEKLGREHCHVVWLRVDLERMTAISDSHNYRKHEEVARELEREFGHQRVQGAHVERYGKPRPKRTPSHAEMLSAERTDISPKEAKKFITELWHKADSGQAFAQALKQHGWLLARGDRRDFVVIDPQGGIHSLSRRVDGATAKDVRERLADLDVTQVPSVAQAKRLQSVGQPTRPKSAPKISQARLHRKSVHPGIVGPHTQNLRRRKLPPGGGAAQSPPKARALSATSHRRSHGVGRMPLEPLHSTGQASVPFGPTALAFHFLIMKAAETREEFRAAAAWMTTRLALPDGDERMGDAGDGGDDTELSGILDAIVAEVMRKADGARAGVIAEYAGKIAHARKTLPPQQATGAVGVLLAARAAALSQIAKDASEEIASRRGTVLRARPERRRPKPPDQPFYGAEPN